jgi:hypothetical protein
MYLLTLRIFLLVGVLVANKVSPQLRERSQTLSVGYQTGSRAEAPLFVRLHQTERLNEHEDQSITETTEE